MKTISQEAMLKINDDICDIIKNHVDGLRIQNNNLKEYNSRLLNLIAELREHFDFPEELNMDNGYRGEGQWSSGAIICDPEECLHEMIAVAKWKKLNSHELYYPLPKPIQF